MSRTVIGVAALGVAAIAGSASALPIQFTHAGTGAGTLDGESFGPTAITITAFGDTDDRVEVGGFAYFIAHSAASVSIDGVGDFDFTIPTISFVNNNVAGVGFSHDEVTDLLQGPFDPAFAGWDMLTSIGPVAGKGNLLGWDNAPVTTTGGVLFIEPGASDLTFQALVIPAPGVAGLLGLAGFAATRRRR